jgi:hypothetical protein
MLAYNSLKDSEINPFMADVTNSGACLVLRNEIQQRKTKPGVKHLYIYEV